MLETEPTRGTSALKCAAVTPAQCKCFLKAPADTESDTCLGGTASLFRLGDDKYSLHESTKPMRCPHRHASHTRSLLYSSYSSCLYEIGSPVPSPDPKEHNCGWCMACFAALGMLSPQGNHCGLWRLEDQPGQDVLFILALNTFELKT